MLHRSVAAGDEFTVPVRDRSHLIYPGGDIRVVIGDATSSEAVAKVVDGSGVVFSESGRHPALLSTQYISICEHVSANVVRMLGTHQSLQHAVVPITRMYRPSDRGLTPWNRDSSSVLRLAHSARSEEHTSELQSH